MTQPPMSTVLTKGRRDAGAAPWSDDRSWDAKIAADRERAARVQSPEQRALTAEVFARSLAKGAQAFALTGSTARGKRTEISDLDFHVVGPRPAVYDLPGEIDIYAGDAEHFWAKLRSGDDMVQWTLRCGCILYDTGIFRAGLKAIETEALWPSASAKLARIPAHVRVASRLIRMGDRDAAQAEARAALTTAARGLLLQAGVFPLARIELPEQLSEHGEGEIAKALAATIHSDPSLAELERALATLDSLTGALTQR